MIDGPTATIIAAVLAATVGMAGFMSVVYYRLGKLEGIVEGLDRKLERSLADNKELTLSENSRLSEKIDTDISRLSEKMDAQHAETMAAIQRLTDAFLSHSHDDDGNVMFRIPPGGSTD